MQLITEYTTIGQAQPNSIVRLTDGRIGVTTLQLFDRKVPVIFRQPQATSGVMEEFPPHTAVEVLLRPLQLANMVIDHVAFDGGDVTWQQE
jgi:hypothetical protein